MQKREQVILDDAYFDFDDPLQAEGYEQESYGQNRADSIWWACERCRDDDQIKDFIFDLRTQFRGRLQKDFPSDAVISAILEDGEDPNHFFVCIGNFAEKEYSPALKAMALFFCKQLKEELNLDLHPSFFKEERPHNKKPPKTTIRLPKSRT